jgi:DNA repair exonuclease SbcCD ATPase subunit
MILVILLLVPACNRGNPSAVRAESEQTSPTLQDMQRERDDYVNSIQAKLDDLDKKIDSLNAGAPKLTPKTKADFADAIKGVKDQRTIVAQKLDELKNAAISYSWRTTKSAVESALADLERSYQNVESTYQQIPAAPPKTY